MKLLLKIGYYSIIIIVIAIAAILFLPVLPISGNIDTKIVLSGSMEPQIRVGSVAVIRPQDEYKIGDIVTYGEDTRDKIPTTHRIIEMRAENGVLLFTTKGDANTDPDAREIKESDIHGKVLFSIPYLGYLISFAKTKIGFILIIAIPTTIIVLDEIRKIYKEAMTMRRRKQKEAEEA